MNRYLVTSAFCPRTALLRSPDAIREIQDSAPAFADPSRACTVRSFQKSLGGAHPHACDGFYATFTRNRSSAPGNIGPAYGELFRNPELAETYAGIRDGGASDLESPLPVKMRVGRCKSCCSRVGQSHI
eukprot:SAG11_NODE_13_length_26388_cov_67.360341_26_plen_129_part_00